MQFTTTWMEFKVIMQSESEGKRQLLNNLILCKEYMETLQGIGLSPVKIIPKMLLIEQIWWSQKSEGKRNHSEELLTLEWWK